MQPEYTEAVADENVPDRGSQCPRSDWPCLGKHGIWVPNRSTPLRVRFAFTVAPRTLNSASGIVSIPLTAPRSLIFTSHEDGVGCMHGRRSCMQGRNQLPSLASLGLGQCSGNYWDWSIYTITDTNTALTIVWEALHVTKTALSLQTCPSLTMRISEILWQSGT